MKERRGGGRGGRKAAKPHTSIEGQLANGDAHAVHAQIAEACCLVATIQSNPTALELRGKQIQSNTKRANREYGSHQ